MAGKWKTEDVDRYVGTSIKLQRRSLNLTVDELAKRTDLAPEQIQEHEAGQVQVSVATISRIAEALDVPVSYFFAGIGTAQLGRNIRSQAKGLDLEMLREFSKIHRDDIRQQLVKLARSLVHADR